MRKRKWQRAIAFAASAAMVLNTSGVQSLVQGIGDAVKAAELNSEVILDEETAALDTAAGMNGADDVIVQEVDVWSSYEEPDLVVEEMEVLSSDEAEQVTGDINIEELNAQADMVPEGEVIPMEVSVRLTETVAASDQDGDSTGQSEVQWMHVSAQDLSTGSTGEATIRIYLTDENQAPAKNVEVVLFEEWTAILPDTVMLPPVVLDDVLNETEELRITRQQEYKLDEDGEYVKDASGKKIMTADYLEFTLPSGGNAEFEAALLYRTSEADPKYSVCASATALCQIEDGEESVLYEEYKNKEEDSELTLSWTYTEVQEEESETAVESTTEETTAEPTEIASESTEASTETATEGQSEESTELTSEGMTEESAELPAKTAEDETEDMTEAGSEVEESEFESEQESESESELESEQESESESELESEQESESESELTSEQESESGSQADVPVSSIRVIMTKELAETEALETEEESVILSEESESVSNPEETIMEETASETEAVEEENEDDTAVSGQTYIVHVQAEDLQPEAKYDSIVSIHLTDFATGLPASDVTTTVCQNKEDIQRAEATAESTLAGAVQTAAGTVDLTVNRIQETSAAEDGTEIVTDDYLSFELPAGSTADFYVGFTYATESDSYEKQLMIAVEAVQYIPIEEVQADSMKTTDSNNFDILSCGAEGENQELTGPAQGQNLDQELQPAATLMENDELDVKTQSSDSDTVLAGLGADAESTADSTVTVSDITDINDVTEINADMTAVESSSTGVESTVVVGSESTESGENTEGDGTEVVVVNVLESQSQAVMLWSASTTSDSNSTVIIYFAAPAEWVSNISSGYTIQANMQYGDGVNEWGRLKMTDTNSTYTASDGQVLKVFMVEFTCKYGGLNTLQFQLRDSNDTHKEEKVAFQDSWNDDDVFAGKLYDYISETWVDYTPFDPNDHDFFAGKTMYFENHGSADLSGGVTAIFYEKTAEESLENLKVVATIQMTAVGSDGTMYLVTIPTEACSYVQFVDSEGNILGDTYSNFYGQGENETGIESFIYDETSMNSYHYTSTAEDSTWGMLSGRSVYYDATLSKLSYAGTNEVKNSGKGMPYSDSASMYCYITKADGTGGQALTMTKVSAYTKGGNTWSDVWKADIPSGYTRIRFTAWENPSDETAAANGDGTAMMTIPTDLGNPCFYGDTSDDAIYNGGDRGGYWDEVYRIRDPETEGGGENSVVDIVSSAFTQDSQTLYVNTTFYDYYSDYELNGKNRDSYGGANASNHRYWVNFRQFDQALSEYYENVQASIPIYTGHFQPTEYGTDASPFNAIAGTLNLFGFSNYRSFISTNNSGYDISGTKDKYAYAAQGLVNSTLTNGLPTVKGGSAILPHFNEEFLEGDNAKNTVLGKVYSNVSFPFTKKDVNGDGVEYWYFDSADTTLAMRNDTNGSGYYLQNAGNQDWSKNVNSTGTTSGKDIVDPTYGFFPFNETSTGVSGKNYNYGFGTKLEIKFRLTEDGKVENSSGAKVPIEFAFSGDDDVWVFIDGNLALDIGGAHGRVTGSIDFASLTATVDNVKASAGDSTAGSPKTNSFTLSGSNQSEHTLTMFYMERGMWESNMKIMFNFPDENQLQVEKQVDTTEVNELFQDVIQNNAFFKYSIQNLATHYGAKATNLELVSDVEVNLRTAGLTPANSNVKFRISGASQDNTAVTDKNNENGVVYWYCNWNNASGSSRESRAGTITLNESIDTSKYQYLEFKFWYNWSDTPTLSNMYLDLYSGSTRLTGSPVSSYYISASSVGHDKWVTVKLDLDKMLGTGRTAVIDNIRFSYNYARNVYLKDIVFIPKTEVEAKNVGFITKQYEIPDYGSAASGTLEPAVNAIYSSSTAARSTYRVNDDGNFWLQDGETATFNDQFRRGSYIALKEKLTEEEDALYDTTWTMYENNKAVTSIGTGKKVTSDGTVSSLNNVASEAVDDGRTEYLPASTEKDSESKVIQENNNYDGKQPETETFVFRSYTEPDSDTVTTKLKVVFRNKVNVGSLTLKKEQAGESDDLGDTVYKFDIVFSNVGGSSLEGSETISTTVELKKGEVKTITGIPLGTHYVITEAEAEDGSVLDQVLGVTGTVTASDSVTGTEIEFDKNTRAVEGDVTSEISQYSYIFQNAIKPTVSLDVTKKWQDSSGAALNENVPGSIYVQLQQREAGQTKWTAVSGYDAVEIYPEDGNWEGYKYTFSGLAQYVNLSADESERIKYEYRVVELQWDDTLQQYVVLEDGGTYSESYTVSYGNVIESTAENTTAYSQTITNRLKPTNLTITKKAAGSSATLLQGVVFKLEKLQSDETYVQIGDEVTTGEDGLADFTNLADGTYLLTETKAADGYNLLKSPIKIVIDGASGNYILNDGEPAAIEDGTIKLTVYNQAKFEIPATGSWSRHIISFGGAMLAGAALIMYLLQKRRKEGTTS